MECVMKMNDVKFPVLSVWKNGEADGHPQVHMCAEELRDFLYRHPGRLGGQHMLDFSKELYFYEIDYNAIGKPFKEPVELCGMREALIFEKKSRK